MIIADGVFDFLQQKIDEIASEETTARDYQRFKFDAKISVVEFFNEVITDLLLPTNHDLSIVDHHMHGITTKGAVQNVVRSADDLIVMFEEAASAHNTSKTDFGPASHHAGTVFTISLTQHIAGDRVVSQFQFIEVPCTDKLLVRCV